MHGDVRPPNTLTHEGTFEIADPGLASLKLSEDASETEWHAGTPMYAPSEWAVGGLGRNGRVRDVWALGCVLLEILTLLVNGFCKPAAADVFGGKTTIVSDNSDKSLLSGNGLC